jgi:hypothetical protein
MLLNIYKDRLRGCWILWRSMGTRYLDGIGIREYDDISSRQISIHLSKPYRNTLKTIVRKNYSAGLPFR